MQCAAMSGQHYACIWQFCIAPLESWATLLARGSNDVGQAKIQAKMHLSKQISAYIEALKYKLTCQ